jgi:hypothetical protein
VYAARQHEDAGADDDADPEDGEVEGGEVLAELVVRLLGVADGVLDGLDPAGSGHGVLPRLEGDRLPATAVP